ncbi:MAG TPA: hypothetical protein VM243_17310 [Phycisphaerae bacterium]|nr:hypothetical protein [Phycisphaerae bacterium]
MVIQRPRPHAVGFAPIRPAFNRPSVQIPQSLETALADDAVKTVLHVHNVLA